MQNAVLIHNLQQLWNPLFHQVLKVKPHREFQDARELDDLYTILGNDLADKTAKQINSYCCWMPHVTSYIILDLTKMQHILLFGSS